MDFFFFFNGWWYTVSLYHLVRWMSHEGIYLFTDILGGKLKVLCHSLSQQLSLSCRKLWKMHFLFLLRKKKKKKDVKTNQKNTEDSALSLFQLNKPKTHIDFPTGKASDWYVESRQHQTPPAVAALQKCRSICQKPGGHCSCFQKAWEPLVHWLIQSRGFWDGFLENDWLTLVHWPSASVVWGRIFQKFPLSGTCGQQWDWLGFLPGGQKCRASGRVTWMSLIRDKKSTFHRRQCRP